MDELFDRKTSDKEKEIEEYEKRSSEYLNRGEVIKSLALLREATQKYPGDFHCLNGLAHALYSTLFCGGETDIIETNAKECIAICDRILRDCKDIYIRDDALGLAVHLYSHNDFSFANEEKAEEYAMMAGSLYN